MLKLLFYFMPTYEHISSFCFPTRSGSLNHWNHYLHSVFIAKGWTGLYQPTHTRRLENLLYRGKQMLNVSWWLYKKLWTSSSFPRYQTCIDDLTWNSTPTFSSLLSYQKRLTISLFSSCKTIKKWNKYRIGSYYF